MENALNLCTYISSIKFRISLRVICQTTFGVRKTEIYWRRCIRQWFAIPRSDCTSDSNTFSRTHWHGIGQSERQIHEESDACSIHVFSAHKSVQDGSVKQKLNVYKFMCELVRRRSRYKMRSAAIGFKFEEAHMSTHTFVAAFKWSLNAEPLAANRQFTWKPARYGQIIDRIDWASLNL